MGSYTDPRLSTSTTFVKKKAALTLLRLYRKHPSVLDVNDWAERIVGMMGDPDPGVALTATSLVMGMAQANLEAFSGCYQKAVDKLDKVSEIRMPLISRLMCEDHIRWGLSGGVCLLQGECSFAELQDRMLT